MVELEDLPSVGEKTAQKLRDAGFADMMRLATATPKELSVKVEIGEGVAAKVIEAARKAEKIDFETAFEVMERREDVGRITTGSKGLDELINFVSRILGQEDNNIFVFEEDYFEEEKSDKERFVFKKISDGYYEVSGKAIEKMMGYNNFETESGFDFFQKYMYENNIISELKKIGLKEGDTVRILDYEFEYIE